MEDFVQKDNIAAINSVEKENRGAFTVFLRFLRRFIVLILVFTVLGTVGGFVLARKKDQTVYTQTKAVVVVASIDQISQANNITLTDILKNTIARVTTTPIIIDRAREIYIENCNNAQKKPNGTVSSGAISVESGDNLIFDISYSSSSAADAADKLDAFIAAVQEQTSVLFQDYANQVNLYPIDNAPALSTSNGFVKFMLLGVLGGLVAGLAIAFILYILDNTVSSKSELEALTGATVVAYIDDVVQK